MSRAAAGGLTAALVAGAAAAAPVAEIEAGGARIALAPTDIAAVATTGTGTLDLRLADASATALAALTAAHRGEAAAFSICGRVVIRPVIRAPIDTGVVRVALADAARAAAVAEILRGGADCAAFPD